MAIVDRQVLSFVRRRADAVQPRPGAIAGIDQISFRPVRQDFLVQRKALTLERRPVGIVALRPFIIGKAQPLQILLDAANVFPAAPLPVDVLDAKDDGAALLPGPQPIQKSNPHIAQVHVPRGTGGKSRAYHRTSHKKIPKVRMNLWNLLPIKLSISQAWNGFHQRVLCLSESFLRCP